MVADVAERSQVLEDSSSAMMPGMDMVNLEAGWPTVKVDLACTDAAELAPAAITLENRDSHARRHTTIVASRFTLFLSLEHGVSTSINFNRPAFGPDLTNRASHVIEARDAPKVFIADPLS